MKPPTIIHLIWIGDSLPQSSRFPYQYFTRSWAHYNPSWQVWLWRDKKTTTEVRWAAEQNILIRHIDDLQCPVEERKRINEHIALKCWSVASDFLRLRILWEHGGIYVDSDVEPRVLPIASLPFGIAMLLKKRVGMLSFVAPHVLISVQNHPIWALALEEALANCRLYDELGEDWRQEALPEKRFAAGLGLTGDLWRPAMARIKGLLVFPEYRWTAHLDQINLTLSFVHREDHSWLDGVKRLKRLYQDDYMEQRFEQQRIRSLQPIMTLAELREWCLS